MNDFDLHMHSNYSKDGQFDVKDLIQIAKEKGLKTIALTDHDCMRGVEEIVELGKKEGIRVIPGIECSTKLGKYDVHLLGYGIDIHDSYLNSLYDEKGEKMLGAFHIRCEKLRKKYGVEINEKQVIQDSHGKNPWFLLMTQIFNNPKYQSIPDFKDYIPGGKRSDPAPVNFFWDRCGYGSDLYVESDNPDFFDSIKKIHEAGGIAIIAHPFTTFYKNDDLLQKAIENGLDGIEAYSNYHDSNQCAYYEKFAKSHHLLITCGSDFHGEKKPSIEMGSYGLKKDGSQFIQKFLKKIDSEN